MVFAQVEHLCRGHGRNAIVQIRPAKLLLRHCHRAFEQTRIQDRGIASLIRDGDLVDLQHIRKGEKVNARAHSPSVRMAGPTRSNTSSTILSSRAASTPGLVRSIRYSRYADRVRFQTGGLRFERLLGIRRDRELQDFCGVGRHDASYCPSALPRPQLPFALAHYFFPTHSHSIVAGGLLEMS